MAPSLLLTGMHRRTRPRLAIVFCAVVLAYSCGGSSPSGPTPQPPATPPPTPTPTPTPSPTPAPTPTLAQIGGAWTGSHELQQQGSKRFGRIGISFEQNDRAVHGPWLFTSGAGSESGSFNAWHGQITGTLTLDGSGTTRFNGTATIVAEIQTGTGACHGRVTLEGTVSASSMRLEGPNVAFSDCLNTIGGFVWILSADGSNSPPPPPPPPTPAPPGQPGSLSCTASASSSEPAATTTIDFDEPEIEIRRTSVYSDGSYSACPLRSTPDVLQSFSLKGVSLQGRYQFRSLWNGCTSSNPSVWDGGVLQASDSNLTIGITTASKPTAVRFSLGVGGSAPSPRFDLTVTDSTGATATTTATTVLGRIAVSCNNPISSVRIGHDGAGWILDSLAF
jgi:hypothetical protein